MITRPNTNKQRMKRHKRVRAKISGTPVCPRLNVFRSEANIYAQVIDDVDAKTICTASTLDPEFRAMGKLGSNKEAAEIVGELVGKRALEKGITEVTFDWIKMKIAPKESLTFDDLYDPETNIRFGSYFVSYCLDRYSGHLATAAAAYHSGVGTVDGLLGQEAYSTDGVTLDHYPYPQMRLYVKKITESYQHYSEIYK